MSGLRAPEWEVRAIYFLLGVMAALLLAVWMDGKTEHSRLWEETKTLDAKAYVIEKRLNKLEVQLEQSSLQDHSRRGELGADGQIRTGEQIRQGDAGE